MLELSTTKRNQPSDFATFVLRPTYFWLPLRELCNLINVEYARPVHARAGSGALLLCWGGEPEQVHWRGPGQDLWRGVLGVGPKHLLAKHYALIARMQLPNGAREYPPRYPTSAGDVHIGYTPLAFAAAFAHRGCFDKLVRATPGGVVLSACTLRLPDALVDRHVESAEVWQTQLQSLDADTAEYFANVAGWGRLSALDPAPKEARPARLGLCLYFASCYSESDRTRTGIRAAGSR